MAFDTNSTSRQPKDLSRWLKAIVFAGFAAVLVWEVDSRTFVAFLANLAPEQVLRIRWQQSTALLELAQLDALDNSNQASGNVHQRGSEANLGGAVAPDGLPDADRAHAENIEQARRVCGFWAGSPAFQGTSRADGGSCRRPCAVPETLAWLTSKSAERLDYTAALRYAEVPLRTRPQLSTAVRPLLARRAENEVAATGLKKMLSWNPPSRAQAQFFDTLPNSITDTRTPLDRLVAVKHSPVPPAADELNSYLNFIAARMVIPA